VLCVSCIRIENHEFCAKLFADVFHEVESKSTQSIAVADDKFCDTSLENGVQNFDEPSSFPIESRSNVLDDPVEWAFRFEVFDLPLEVALLVLATDASVADFFFEPFSS